MPGEQYDVVLSFAREQRPYVREVARHLRDNGIEVFYDEDEQVPLWGADLAAEFAERYRTGAGYCVLFASAAYARRRWARWELRAALARQFADENPYILPVRFDDTPIPGLVDTTGHLDARVVGPAEVAALVMAKVGRPADLKPVTSSILVLAAEAHGLALDEVMDTALAQSDMPLPATARHRRPQWTAAILPAATYPVAEVLSTLVRALLDIGRPNLSSGDVLRIALHADAVVPGDWADRAVATAIDVALAPAVVALAAGTTNAVVAITQPVFDSVVVKGRHGASPTSYHAVRLPGGQTAHVRLVGHLGTPRTLLPEDPPPQGVSHGGSWFNGNKGTVNIFANEVGDRYYGGQHG